MNTPEYVPLNYKQRAARKKDLQDVFIRQLGEKKRVQRAAARIRAKEPGIAIGVGGELQVVSPGQLRSLRQKELQDVFGPQESSLLSKKIKQDKIISSQRAVAQGRALQAQIDAQKQVAQSVSMTGVTKQKSSIKVGKQKLRWTPVFEQGKLIGYQQSVDGINKTFLPYDAYKNQNPIKRSTTYEAAFDIESTPGKKRINMHAQTVEGPSRFRVKAGRTVEFGGKTYKGGQYVPTQAGLIDNIIGRASQGTTLLPAERSFLEENYPANYLEKIGQKRLQVGTPDPDSLANLTQSQIKRQFITDDAKRLAETDKRVANRLRDAQVLEERAQINQQRIQATLSAGFKDPSIETSYAKIAASNIDEVAQVTQKKAISTRTMEKLMSSHSLAAGVAAGGLGLMYAFNRKRGEQQLGR